MVQKLQTSTDLLSSGQRGGGDRNLQRGSAELDTRLVQARPPLCPRLHRNAMLATVRPQKQVRHSATFIIIQFYVTFSTNALWKTTEEVKRMEPLCGSSISNGI